MKITCSELRDHFRQAARRCEHCQRKLLPQEVEIAHIVTKGFGGGGWLDVPGNLVALGHAYSCGCHARQHQNNANPSTDDLKAIVAARYRTTVEAVQAELDRALNQLKKGSKYECPFTEFWWQKRIDGYEWGM